MAYADIEAQKKQVENELAQRKLAYQQGLQTQKAETDSVINQNNQYMDEQIKKMNTGRIVNDDKITALQNRRGGFYSGGLDYQLSENLRTTNEGQTSLRRDIGAKNSDLLKQYNMKASQVADQIRLLENESADKIRALVNQELERQRAEAAAAAASRARSSRSRRSSSGSSSGGGDDLSALYAQYLASKGQPTNFFMTPTEAKKRAVNVYAGITSSKAARVANGYSGKASTTKMTANERKRRGL